MNNKTKLREIKSIYKKTFSLQLPLYTKVYIFFTTLSGNNIFKIARAKGRNL